MRICGDGILLARDRKNDRAFAPEHRFDKSLQRARIPFPQFRQHPNGDLYQAAYKFALDGIRDSMIAVYQSIRVVTHPAAEVSRPASQ